MCTSFQSKNETILNYCQISHYTRDEITVWHCDSLLIHIVITGTVTDERDEGTLY